MAVGRRDYTWGFLNEAAVEGRHTESVIKYYTGTVAAGGLENLYTYVVQAGYTLLINRLLFFTASRAIQRVVVVAKGVTVAQVYFSDNYCLDFSDTNPLSMVAGEQITIQFVNNDLVTASYTGSMIGVLQDTIS